jgi:hypothetical protein
MAKMLPKIPIKRKQQVKREKREEKKFAKLKEDGRIVDGYVIPPNTLAANPSKQKHKGGCSAKYYYKDISYICQGCGDKGVWTAKQQQKYYEVQKGNIYNEPKWCYECHNKNIAKKQVKIKKKV